MMNEFVYFDEETKTVLVENHNMLCPNGFPIAVEYTYEEWEKINETNINTDK